MFIVIKYICVRFVLVPIWCRTNYIIMTCLLVFYITATICHFITVSFPNTIFHIIKLQWHRQWYHIIWCRGKTLYTITRQQICNGLYITVWLVIISAVIIWIENIKIDFNLLIRRYLLWHKNLFFYCFCLSLFQVFISQWCWHRKIPQTAVTTVTSCKETKNVSVFQIFWVIPCGIINYWRVVYNHHKFKCATSCRICVCKYILTPANETMLVPLYACIFTKS